MKHKKVKMLVSIASPTWSYAPGNEAIFDEDQADKFIDAGFAQFLEDIPEKVEKTSENTNEEQNKNDESTNNSEITDGKSTIDDNLNEGIKDDESIGDLQENEKKIEEPAKEKKRGGKNADKS